jgi:hypothetical protein
MGNSYTIKQTSQHDVTTCPKTTLTSPDTENEDGYLINTLIGKTSVGFDEIPEFLVKRCLHYTNNALAHMWK